MKKLTLLVALFFSVDRAGAQTTVPCNCTVATPAAGSTPSKPNAAAAPTPGPAAPKTPYILQVQARKLENRDNVFKVIHPDDLILLKLTNPKDFLDSRPNDNAKLVLYADGIALKGVTSDLFNNIRKGEFKATDTETWVTFRLKQDTSTKAAWDNLYKLADSWYSSKLQVHLTMAWEGMLPVKVNRNDLPNTKVTIVYFHMSTFVILSILYLGLIILILVLAVNSDILKEAPKGAYSMAQTQLAYWTVLIIGGFIYSLALTGIPSTLNSSILLLLGISLATNGTATYIDYFQKKQLGATYKAKKSKSFFNDILGDGQSMNMQRFQIFAWNLVLGGYFIIFVINNKTMPVIPDVLLTLAGVSSLGYVAAKPTEV
ncbi:hypothetical protein [Mucilaginibacter boryungensis]|uniref:Uncharacterized protein n=1 Tax=Mucilaginibacter boryungensis TaxID=768480 RepID=A0ABR9XEL8_9SPHI|nr:hypothetical protein [Mucilaginibacter boryungensis]MBE9665716.1 hypothetical protein [Mucilaginibacter boryungensis]